MAKTSKVNTQMYGALSANGRSFLMSDTSERLWHDGGADGDSFRRKLRLTLRAVATEQVCSICVYDNSPEGAMLDVIEPSDAPPPPLAPIDPEYNRE